MPRRALNIGHHGFPGVAVKVLALVTVGVALILWLRFTRRPIDPAWKPPERTICNNRGDRR